MSLARKLLVAALLALVLLYAVWFGRSAQWFALLVFALPPGWLAIMAMRGARRAGFWAGLLALLWFCHGIMLAWTRPAERNLALVETALAVVIVFVASVPGLRARFAKKRA